MPADEKITITVISPHRDDAALALGLAIERWTSDGVHVQILTCFTISDFAPFADARTAHEVTRLRQQEDQHWLNRLGATVSMIDLGGIDAPLRVDVRRDRPTVDRPLGPRDHEAMQQLTAQLTALQTDGLVIAPLAISRHVDHRIARDAALQVCDPQRLAFFEDVPYASLDPSNDLAGVVSEVQAKLGRRISPVSVTRNPSPADKRRLIDVYRSQFTSDQLDRIAASAADGERLWAVAGGALHTARYRRKCAALCGSDK